MQIDGAQSLTVKCIAQRWSCSARHVYTLLDRGEIAYFVLGKPSARRRGIRVKLEEIQRWENANRQGGPSPQETAPSPNEAGKPLPRGAIRLLANVGA